MIERLQIQIEAIRANRGEVRASSGEYLPTRKIEFRPWNEEELCAVLTLNNSGFELCTVHGRRCHLPDPEWIAVPNFALPAGTCRILIAVEDMRHLAMASFRLGINTGSNPANDWRPTDERTGAPARDEYPEIMVTHFDLRRRTDDLKKLEYELEIWIAPESYQLEFTNK